MSCTGTLLDVKRFAVHDGPGVRTTLFLKGCPLRCRWCHNPESISPKPQLAYYAHKCIHCGECLAACPVCAHTMADGNHSFDPSRCTACGACEPVCLGEAVRLYGKLVTVREALELALEDRDFYRPEGGVTLSGGEPLMQADFCSELLQALKAEGIHTALDTCGCVGWDAFERILPATDLFLVDFKHADSAEHRRLTGQDNSVIVANLKRLSDAGAKINVRVPLVPGCNDSEKNLRAMGELLASLRIESVNVLRYHDLARSKYAALHLPDTMPDAGAPDDQAVQEALMVLRQQGRASKRTHPPVR